eukprot:scaffold73018_cov50-Cyclotella_meneghiniana.AAC.1
MPTKLRIPITPDYKSEIPPQKKGGDVKVINSRAHEEILLEAKMLAVPNLYQTTLELGSETKLGITLNKNEEKGPPEIGRINDNSIAHRSGLRQGHRILCINGHCVHSAEDALKLLKDYLAKKSPVELLVSGRKRKNEEATKSRSQSEVIRLLDSRGWKEKPHHDTYRVRIHWLSPELEIPFLYMTSAIEFSDLSKDCSDEEEAWKEYIKRLGNPKKINVAGGYGAMRSALFKKETLISRGWEMNLCYTGDWRVSHWLSPELGLEFYSINQAMEFSDHVSKVSGDEVEAYDKFLEKISEECKTVYVVGGKLALQNALSKKSIGRSSNNEPDTNPATIEPDNEPTTAELSGDTPGKKLDVDDISVDSLSIAFDTAEKTEEMESIDDEAMQTAPDDTKEREGESVVKKGGGRNGVDVTIDGFSFDEEVSADVGEDKLRKSVDEIKKKICAAEQVNATKATTLQIRMDSLEKMNNLHVEKMKHHFHRSNQNEKDTLDTLEAIELKGVQMAKKLDGLDECKKELAQLQSRISALEKSPTKQKRKRQCAECAKCVKKSKSSNVSCLESLPRCDLV